MASVRARPGPPVRHSPVPAQLPAGNGGLGCAAPCGSRPAARRAAARAGGRPARAVLRPGRGGAGRPGRPPAALIITDALTDRFGAFIIIVLGETLTGVVAGLSAEPVSGLTLAVGLAAVVVGFGAARPAPLILGLALVLLLSIPWVFALTRRLASRVGPPIS